MSIFLGLFLFKGVEFAIAWKDLDSQVRRNGAVFSALCMRIRRLLRCLNSAENRRPDRAAEY